LGLPSFGNPAITKTTARAHLSARKASAATVAAPVARLVAPAASQTDAAFQAAAVTFEAAVVRRAVGGATSSLVQVAEGGAVTALWGRTG
jgi:hypothetical protein